MVAVVLTPIYVLQQLSTLTVTSLGSALLGFIYALILDLMVFRFLLIFIMSLIQVRV